MYVGMCINEKYSLHLSHKLQKKLEEAVQSGEILNNLGIALCVQKPEKVFLNSVEPSCENVIKNVDKCMKRIKKEMNAME